MASSLAYPTSAIRAQLVPFLGRAWLKANAKLDLGADGRNRVYLGFEIAPSGDGLRNERICWTGPKIPIKIYEADMFPGAPEEVFFTFMVDPFEMEFPANRAFTAWTSGDEGITKGSITTHPDTAIAEYTGRARHWSYRFTVGAVDLASFQIVLEAIPASVAEMKSCDWGDSLRTGACQIDTWEAVTGNTKQAGCGEGFIPFLQDDRPPRQQRDHLLPSSGEIKLKVAQCLRSMGTSKSLLENQLSGYTPAANRLEVEYPTIALPDDVSPPPAKMPRLDVPTGTTPPTSTQSTGK